MVISCRLGFNEGDEAFRKNSAGKRAEELPADEKSKKTRGSRGRRVVPVANADTASRHQTEYDGTVKKTFKAIDGEANSKNDSRKSRVAPEESFEEQKPQYFEQFHPQPPKGSHRSDDKKPKEKTENPSAEKFLDKCSSPLLLRIGMHCKCEGCVKRMKEIFKTFKGVRSVKIHSDKDIVEVTGTMNTDRLVIDLEEKLKRNVEVITIQNDENDASPTQKDGAGVRHIANITDKASRKRQLYPDVQEKQNLQKTELTLTQPRKWDRNDTEVTGMVHLKIRMHCLEGCIPQTRKTAMEFKGVKSVKVDASRHLVIVVGTINVKELVAYMKEKLNRSVEVVLVQNDNVAVDNKEVEVTKIETLKEPAVARADGRNNKDLKIKKEGKKVVKAIKIEKEVEDVKEEDKKYFLCDGGTKEDKEDNKGKFFFEDKVKEAKGHGYISHVGEKCEELESEGDRPTSNQHYGNQASPRYGPSDYEHLPPYRYFGMFSDENPLSCAIM